MLPDFMPGHTRRICRHSYSMRAGGGIIMRIFHKTVCYAGLQNQENAGADARKSCKFAEKSATPLSSCRII